MDLSSKIGSHLARNFVAAWIPERPIAALFMDSLILGTRSWAKVVSRKDHVLVVQSALGVWVGDIALSGQ